jgi:hypothetical protein
MEESAMRSALKTVLVAGVLLVAVTACFRLTPFALKGVEVNSGACNFNAVSGTTVQGSWAGSMYQLAIEQPANCAAHLESAAVQRVGSHLFVRTRFELPADMAAGCNCGQRVNLNIPGLPQATYSVHVYAWP